MKREFDKPILKSRSHRLSLPRDRKMRSIKYKFLAGALGLLMFISTPIAIDAIANRDYYKPNTSQQIATIENALEYNFPISAEYGNRVSSFKTNKNGINMIVDQEVYDKYGESIEWTEKYLSELFQIINPNVKFNMIIGEHDKNDEKNAIIYTQSSFNGSTALAKTDFTNGYNAFKSQITGAVISLDTDDKYIFDNSKFATRAVLLHETLHAMGLPHISVKEGGNIMSATITPIGPLAMSTNEVRALTILYGNSSNTEEYKDFINWYDGKYQDVLEKSHNIYFGVSTSDDEEERIMNEISFSVLDYKNEQNENNVLHSENDASINYLDIEIQQ